MRRCTLSHRAFADFPEWTTLSRGEIRTTTAQCSHLLKKGKFEIPTGRGGNWVVKKAPKKRVEISREIMICVTLNQLPEADYLVN